jgi:hypothetical protein
MSKFYYTANGSTLEFNNIEGFDNTSIFEDKGCWQDAVNENRIVPTFVESLKEKATRETCEAEAVKQGYDTYGLDKSNNCFIGNNPLYTKNGNLLCDKVLALHVYQKPRDMSASSLTILNELCMKIKDTSGNISTKCYKGTSIDSLFSAVDEIKSDANKNNVAIIKRVDKLDADFTQNTQNTDLKFKTIRENNDKQYDIVKDGLTKQYDTLSSAVKTLDNRSMGFQTKLDELNTHVYNMKSDVASTSYTDAKTNVVNNNITQQPSQP